MAKKKTQKNTIITKIAVSTMIAIFSLASAFAGTYAWFTNNSNVSVTGSSFRVYTKNYTLDSINLYKYNYAEDELTHEHDYLFPERGNVGQYVHTEEDAFVDVNDNNVTTDIMNLYDPLQKIVSGDSFSISELNTNAVYKVQISTTTAISAAKIDVSAYLKTSRSQREQSGSYYLSDYVDFDIITQEEINDIDHTLWYPNYDNAPESMAGNNKFTGTGDPTYCDGEVVGSVYEDTTTGAFWVKESNGWELQDTIVSQYAPSYANSSDYYIKTSDSTVYEYDENVSGVHGHYTALTLDVDYESGSNLPSNSGDIGDIYYYHLDSTHQIYKRTSNGWVKRSNVDYETLYYKVAYLSSIKDWHAHFYNLDPLETVSLNPKNDIYYKNNDSWTMHVNYTGGMSTPNHNQGSANDCYYDYAANLFYIKDADGGWKSKSNITKVSDIQDPNLNVSFTGSDSPWSHDYGEVSVQKGNTYINTTNNNVYLFIGSDDSGKTTQLNWELQSLTYDANKSFITGNAGDYYIYSANEMGDANDIYLDVTNYAVYIKGDTWEKQDGVFAGDEQPESGDYVYFINTSNNTLKKKVAGVWNTVSPAFIRNGSPQLLYINNGTSNDPWALITPNIYGNDTPAINTGNDNNVFLDTSSNVLYVKTNNGGWISHNVGMNSNTAEDYYVDLSSDLQDVNFESDGNGNYVATIYINVNYSPSQLAVFSDLLQESENLTQKFRAYLDFGFSFSFSGEVMA